MAKKHKSKHSQETPTLDQTARMDGNTRRVVSAAEAEAEKLRKQAAAEAKWAAKVPKLFAEAVAKGLDVIKTKTGGLALRGHGPECEQPC